MRNLFSSLAAALLFADAGKVAGKALPQYSDVLVEELPTATKQSTKELVEEIHHAFNTVGDKLLAEATAVLAGTDSFTLEKGERLKALGFGNTKQAKETQEAADKAAEARKQQQLIMDYAIRYPTNKFITRSHVDAIAAKYHLVVGDTTAYTGFVPDKNLSEVEAFNKRFQDSDKPSDTARILKWTYAHQNELHAIVKAKYPTLEIPLTDKDFKHTAMHTCYMLGTDYAFIEMHERMDKSSQLICAPLADMDLSKLSQHDGQWFKAKQVHTPDPVVLQPVKGGFLIVTAWGDEASDPLVMLDNIN